jgi:hypothetical protein
MTQTVPSWLAMAGLVLLCGCASQTRRQAEIDAAFQAGQEAAYELMGQSGIPVVRMVGPFQRGVILWRNDLTLAEAFLEAGYQLEKAPSQILVHRGRNVQPVNASRLLTGNDVLLDPGITVRVVP